MGDFTPGYLEIKNLKEFSPTPREVKKPKLDEHGSPQRTMKKETELKQMERYCLKRKPNSPQPQVPIPGSGSAFVYHQSLSDGGHKASASWDSGPEALGAMIKGDVSLYSHSNRRGAEHVSWI